MKSGKSKKTVKTEQHDKVPQHKKDFDQFHQENGVRTIQGDIGPVRSGELLLFCIVPDAIRTHPNSLSKVRMLLKNGYRHVYISRKFALRHGFIPHDATPGHYGYGGLVK